MVNCHPSTTCSMCSAKLNEKSTDKRRHSGYLGVRILRPRFLIPEPRDQPPRRVIKSKSPRVFRLSMPAYAENLHPPAAGSPLCPNPEEVAEPGWSQTASGRRRATCAVNPSARRKAITTKLPCSSQIGAGMALSRHPIRLLTWLPAPHNLYGNPHGFCQRVVNDKARRL